MSYFVCQSGFEGVWLKEPVDVARYLCELFGLDLQENIVKLTEQITLYPSLGYKDLALRIERY